MFEGIAIGVGSAIISGFIVFVVVQSAKLWHTPKRLDRVETLLPVLVRAVFALLLCQKSGKCNGETDDSITEIKQLLSDGIVSRKAGK